MARLTKWDSVRGCYVIVPDSTQNHIQRLGELEDRDEAKEPKYTNGFGAECPKCARVFECEFDFCPECGQRMKWSEDA